MERTYTLHEIAATFRRRWLLATAVALAVALVAGGVILALPSEYMAQSVVQIEPHRLAPEMLPAAPAASFDERMRTLKHQLLARPVLERVVSEVHPYPDLENDLDGAVERLRHNVEVRLEGEVAGGPPALLFVVEVRGHDPQKVARAAELLPSIYAELTRKTMSDQAHRLTQTFDDQVTGAQVGLASLEQKLLQFKQGHAQELPESIETNLRAAGRAESQIEMRLASIADASRQRTLVVSSIPEDASEAGRAATGADLALRRLETARATFGVDSPDVKRLEREYASASARAEEEQRRFAQGRIARHTALLDQGIAQDQEAVRDLQRDLSFYQQRVEQAPRWGAELVKITRDYDAMKTRYNALILHAADARSAEAVAAADAGSLFDAIQPAVAPQRPIGPARTQLLLAALVAALAAGAAAAAAAELLDSSLRGPEDATGFGAPVLAAIPRIGAHHARS